MIDNCRRISRRTLTPDPGLPNHQSRGPCRPRLTIRKVVAEERCPGHPETPKKRKRFPLDKVPRQCYQDGNQGLLGMENPLWVLAIPKLDGSGMFGARECM